MVDKKYPCNTIRDIILKCAKKAGVNNYNPTIDDELEIWHLLYSIADKEELSKALKSYVEKKNLPYEFADALSLTPAFKNEYGAYSEKALKKMLPLMRQGYYWTEEAIDVKTKERIGKLISGEYDENISDRVREKVVELTDISNYQGLPVWLASYVVYNRHSEAKDIKKWKSPSDIDDYLKEFKQHSMRNPIVEQVILETLRTVRDIWKQVGQIDEIHVELGREMKNPADKRKAMTGQIQENEKTNQRIRLLLAEFAKNYSDIKDVRDYSPSQHEILKIYEEGVLSQVDPNDNHSKEGLDISKKAEPSAKEIQIYKEWLGQHYRSPYTGEVISLCELFTPQYEIEHIIPQSRYFDDSLSNKVVCEAAVNKLKGNMLGREFIKSHQGEIVDLGNGKTVKIFTIDEYTDFVNRHYKGSKREKLLLEDIPDGFIERQLNDSRYISKEVKGLLSNIVREEGEQEAISKNVITCNGSITDRLKQDWGMNSVWNKIILPRFVRMNELTKSDKYVTLSKEGHYIPDVPIDEKKGFNKKRIDHRHHAMDAIVIACATRNHVNLLNNEAARTKNKDMRNQLSRKLRRYENVEVIENGEKRVKNVAKEFIAPWDNFAVDAYNKLSNIVVSFKQNLRVINKTKNKYTKFVDGKKSIVTQEKGDKWAIRKSLHGGSVYGEIKIESQDGKTLKSALKNIDLIVNKKLREELKMLSEKGYSEKQIKEYFEINKDVWNGINLNSIKVFQRRFSDRKVLNKEFSKKIIEDNIADLVVRKILLAHLEENGGNAELAFSPDGIVEMNKNIVKLNNGKPHAPIRSVSKSRSGDKKFALGKSGAKLKKFVNGDVGANFYCAVREIKKIDKKTNKITIERSFKIIPLNEVIENLKQGKPIAPFVEGEKFLFTLSPNDLVYCPTKEQYGKVLTNSDIDCKRIYKMVSCDDGKCYFLPYSVASVIKKGVEFESLNKSQKAIPIELSSYESVCKLLKNNNINISEGEMIKNTCLPIKVDRLGNIIEIGY